MPAAASGLALTLAASAAIASLPSAVRRASCSALNGCASAVPCTSMNAPLPVITRFMSTSAVLSSL